MNDEIRKIAESVHRWALRHRKKFDEDNQSHLQHMCAIASWELFKRLKARGYKPTLIIGYGHAFVKLNGYIVDVTSKQFGLRAIEIRPFRDRDHFSFWTPTAEATTLRGAKRVLKWWSDNQVHPDLST